jgi:hypothetical protein
MNIFLVFPPWNYKVIQQNLRKQDHTLLAIALRTSLHESFPNSHAPVKREHELHESR